jgi:hypothetical protein
VVAHATLRVLEALEDRWYDNREEGRDVLPEGDGRRSQTNQPCLSAFICRQAGVPPFRVCMALLAANMPHNWSMILEMRAPSDDSTCLRASART